MRINKVLIILLFPLIAELVVSCCNHCIDPLIGHYTNKTILVKNIDNSGSVPMITTANSVLKEAFGIRAQLGREMTACLNLSKYLFIRTASAMKCECPPPNQIFARDSVTAIQIFTINDFDTNHSSNSDVSEYFKVFKNSSFSTITDFLKDYNAVLYSESELDLTIDLLLMTPPGLNISHSFKIKITLSDGRNLEGVSNAIELK